MVHPQLSEFCKQLTTISQENGEKAPTFPEVLIKFESWAQSFGLMADNTHIITFSGWDLEKCLPRLCSYYRMPVPTFLQPDNNLNMKMIYFSNMHEIPKSIPYILERLGLSFDGIKHRGLDDVRGQLKVVRYALENTCELDLV